MDSSLLEDIFGGIDISRVDNLLGGSSSSSLLTSIDRTSLMLQGLWYLLGIGVILMLGWLLARKAKLRYRKTNTHMKLLEKNNKLLEAILIELKTKPTNTKNSLEQPHNTLEQPPQL